MFQFVKCANGFELRDGDRVLFDMNVGDVAVFVGNGKADYSMFHGSFKIKEHTYNKVAMKTVAVDVVSDKRVEVELPQGKVIGELVTDKRVKVSFEGLEEYNRLWVKLPATKDECVYGSGETFTEFNLRGKNVNVWVAEHINAFSVAKKVLKMCFGVRNSKRKEKFSNYETYYVQPTFLSSNRYFYHSETTARAEFDFTNKDFHIIKTDAVSDFYIGYGDTFEEVITNLTDLLGRQPELPDWVYDGHILGVQGGTDTMLDKLKTAKDYGFDVTGLWIQDWEGRRVTAAGKQLFWNWQWDEELYPGLDKKIKELNEQGVKVLGYCNPFLAVEKPLYEYASKMGYCVKDAEGNDYYVKITTFPAAMVDLSNPDAYDWLKGIIKKNMIEFGLSGWMADFGEYLPTDCVLYSGEDPELAHNTWPARWAKLNREAIEESGKLGEIMFFTRAGYTETIKYSTMMWNGDNHVDFSVDYGMPSVIPAMLSLTCSGYGMSHSDVGGYTSIMKLQRPEELYMRWCEMNAFSPVLRGHEGLNPDVNAQFDCSDRCLKHGAKMSQIHKALKPYLKDAVKYNAECGVGVVRPLFFYYDEPQAYTEAYEYLLGRDILVAPVIEAGAKTRKVYLPNDEWIQIGTGKEFKGGVYTVDAPIGQIPVFVRKHAPESVLNITNNITLEEM